MGTSTSFTGGKNSNPLIPDWLGSDGGNNNPDKPEKKPSDKPETGDKIEQPSEDTIPNRFTSARRNFNTFTKSGGSDGASLKRSVASYITKTSGGYRKAARRMKSERTAIARFSGILADAGNNGIREVVKRLNLDHLANRPVIEIYAALVDVICEPGGDLDSSFSRDAYIEAIVEVSEMGITDLETPSKETILTLIERCIVNSIRDRILNAIGNNAIVLPDNIQVVQRIQRELLDFINGAVSDAMVEIGPTLSASSIQNNIGTIFERSFQILQSLSEQESDE